MPRARIARLSNPQAKSNAISIATPAAPAEIN
jgi:hypothetical protein